MMKDVTENEMNKSSVTFYEYTNEHFSSNSNEIACFHKI